MVSVFTILGALSLVGGCIGYLTFPAGLSFGVKSMVNLAEKGMVYPHYMNPPFATQSKFQLFEITNPRQVLRGEKMRFRTKGPYYYKTYLKRDNIMFVDSSQRVKFDSHRKLYPAEEISADFDEKMWLLNPIIPAVQKSVKSIILDRIPFQRLSEPIVFNAVNVLLDNYKERLVIRTTPRTFLNGRKVELLQMLTDLAGRFGLGSLLPPGPPKNVFGLAFVQNETVDTLELYTGVGNSKDKFAEVISWNAKTKVEVWQGRCSKIRGTNGELYKPLVNTSRALAVFFAPLCRSFTIVPVRNESITTDTGMIAWEYEFNPKIYSGARREPKNKCYCEDTRTYDCQYDGLLPMGPCFFDSPLFFSRANFKGVDWRIKDTTEYEKSIENQVADKQTIALDQITGSVLAVNITLMAVFKVVRQPLMRDLTLLQNLTYAPAFVTTESFELPFDVAWQIYLLQKVNNYHKPIMMGTAATGAATLIWRYLFGG